MRFLTSFVAFRSRAPETPVGAYISSSLCGFSFSHSGFHDSPEQTTCTVGHRQFVRQTSLEQGADGVVAGDIRGSSQCDVFANAQVEQVNCFRQNKHMPCNRRLYLSKLFLEILYEDFL